MLCFPGLRGTLFVCVCVRVCVCVCVRVVVCVFQVKEGCRSVPEGGVLRLRSDDRSLLRQLCGEHPTPAPWGVYPSGRYLCSINVIPVKN